MNPSEVIRALVRPILSKPSSLEINAQIKGRVHFVNVRVNMADMGRMIGKGGINIQTLKILGESLKDDNGNVVRVTLLEAINGFGNARPVTPNPRWKPDDCLAAAETWLLAMGLPSEMVSNEAHGSHCISLAEPLRRDYHDALNRWVGTIAMTQGGRCYLEPNAVPA